MPKPGSPAERSTLAKGPLDRALAASLEINPARSSTCGLTWSASTAAVARALMPAGRRLPGSCPGSSLPRRPNADAGTTAWALNVGRSAVLETLAAASTPSAAAGSSAGAAGCTGGAAAAGAAAVAVLPTGARAVAGETWLLSGLWAGEVTTPGGCLVVVLAPASVRSHELLHQLSECGSLRH